MTNETNQTEKQTVSPERQDAKILVANQLLSRTNLAEALAQVSLNALIQLTQNKAMDQAEQQLEAMTDEEVSEFLENAKKQQEEAQNAAQQAVDQVSNEPASTN